MITPSFPPLPLLPLPTVRVVRTIKKTQERRQENPAHCKKFPPSNVFSFVFVYRINSCYCLRHSRLHLLLRAGRESDMLNLKTGKSARWKAHSYRDHSEQSSLLFSDKDRRTDNWIRRKNTVQPRKDLNLRFLRFVPGRSTELRNCDRNYVRILAFAKLSRQGCAVSFRLI